ncbi:hypothetical protein [Vibrio phage vB_VpaP_C2]|nr:hypothetical protein [Vibrio phage vB_VpaP_C2]USL89967.1 hypothetical protein [Vibrio phage vB_VpaP_M3]
MRCITIKAVYTVLIQWSSNELSTTSHLVSRCSIRYNALSPLTGGDRHEVSPVAVCPLTNTV